MKHNEGNTMIDGVIMQAATFEAKVPERSEHCWCTHNADSQVSIKQYFSN